MNLKYLLFFSFVFFLLGSCKDTNSHQDFDNNDTSVQDSLWSEEKEKETITVYAWVDKLRMRSEPNTSGDILAEIPEGGALTFLGERTDFRDQFTMRGKSFDEPWLKVEVDGKEGWVYGGGVKFYEPKVAIQPTPYDRCMDFLKRRRRSQMENCFSAKSQQLLTQDKKWLSSDGEGKLTIELLSGDLINLNQMAKDDPAIENKFFYRYYIPKMGFFVLEVENDKENYYVLVNDKSGKMTKIWGYPYASPDNTMLLVSNGDLDNEQSHNGIQLWSFTDKGLENIWEKELKETEPIIAKWLDIEEAEITLLPSRKSGSLKLKASLLAKNENGEWELKDAK